MALAIEIVFALGREKVTLRPALRHAMRLEQRNGSFAKLAADIQDGSLSAAVAIIGPIHPVPFLEQKIMDTGLANLAPALLEFILQCAGLDGEQGEAPTTQAEPVTFREHLTRLYRVATGWLGWPPQVALDATPAEITEAYKGRVELLKAVFGTSEQRPEPRDTNESFKTVLRSFGTTKIAREGMVQ